MNEKKTERVYSFANAYSAYVSKNGRYLNFQVIRKLADGREELITIPVLLRGNADAIKADKNITARVGADNSAFILINELFTPKNEAKPAPSSQAEYHAGEQDDVPF